MIDLGKLLKELDGVISELEKEKSAQTKESKTESTIEKKLEIAMKNNFSKEELYNILTKEELIFRDKKYSLREIEKIGDRTRTLKNGICYVLKTKSGKTIFEFEKFEVMSYQVFISAINKFTSN